MSRATDFMTLTEDLFINMELDEAKWSKGIKTKWHPPEGFFKRSGEDIAKGLKAASSGLKQAVARLNFYRNRAGKNLSKEDKGRLDAALTKLQGLYASA